MLQNQLFLRLVNDGTRSGKRKYDDVPSEAVLASKFRRRQPQWSGDPRSRSFFSIFFPLTNLEFSSSSVSLRCQAIIRWLWRYERRQTSILKDSRRLISDWWANLVATCNKLFTFQWRKYHCILWIQDNPYAKCIDTTILVQFHSF